MSRCLLFVCRQVLQRRRRPALRRLPQRRPERPRVRRPAALSPQARRPVSYSQSCCKSPSPNHTFFSPTRPLSSTPNDNKTTTNHLALRTVRVSVLSPTVESLTNRYTSTNARSNEPTHAPTNTHTTARTLVRTHARTHNNTNSHNTQRSVRRSVDRTHRQAS